MPEPGVWIEPPRVCKHLRSKAYHMNVGFHPSGTEGVPLPGWCLKTMQVFGPDNDEATEHACNPDRPCFEE